MATKSFKIGECAVGGIIKVVITGKVIQIEALDYYSKKQVMVGTISSNEEGSRRKIDNFLNELTSSYYAGKVMEYIEKNINLKKLEWEL